MGMQWRWVSRVCLAWLAATVCVVAQAEAAVTVAQLLRPNLVEQMQLSPSGKRISFLNRGIKSDRDFTIVEIQDGQLTPIFVTQLPKGQSFSVYRWLSDNYLSLSYESKDETLEQLAIADIAQHKVTLLEQVAHIVKAKWQDDQHALISTSSGCALGSDTTLGRCLVSLNLDGSGRNLVTPKLDLFPVGFVVLPNSEIYARGSDSKRNEHAMRFDADAGKWQEISMEQYQAASRAEVKESAPGSLFTDSRGTRGVYVGAEGQRPVGYNTVAPVAKFKSLSADFDDLEVILETQFAGKSSVLAQVSDDLRSGLVFISSSDEPSRYALWQRGQPLQLLSVFDSPLYGQQLGNTRVESNWLSGSFIRVVAPPSGMPVTGVVINPVFMSEQFLPSYRTGFDGVAQSFAMSGVVYVQVYFATPEQFANGDAAQAWREKTRQSLQTVITAASKQLVNDGSICLYAEDYVGAWLLTDTGYDHVACVAAVDAPLQPERLDKPIEFTGGLMKLSNMTLVRDVRGVFALPSGKLLDPVEQVVGLPNQVMLGYDLTEPVNAVFGRQSRDFRSALKKADKQVTYQAPLVGSQDESTYQANLLATVIEFVAKAGQGGASAAAHK